jgi:ubiquinone/menaquinone biosynthesis C-methylase UbiE
MSGEILKNKVTEYYDEVAKDYMHDRESEYGFEIQKKHIFEMIGDVDGKGRKAVDIGCGSGLLTRELVSRGYEVCGIDVSEKMIENAMLILKEQNIDKSRVHYLLGDIENLSFPDNYFDIIISIGVLGSLPSYRKALNEIYRVLKPEGLAIIALGSRISPYFMAYMITKKTVIRLYHLLRHYCFKREVRSAFERNFCLPWDFKRQVRDAGFVLLDNVFCFFIFYPLHQLFPGLSVAISRKLELLSRFRILRLMGSQFIVKLTKRV